jgi:hypothetical protein
MNGTVTMKILSIVVKAKTFVDAVEKVKKLPNFCKAEIRTENDLEFTYYIAGPFPCCGSMKNEALRTISA